MRYFLIGGALLYAVLSPWGMYRRIWQVQRADLSVPSAPLAPGSAVDYDVITSGEVSNLMRLELVQGARIAVLLERRGRVSASNTIDPRLFRMRGSVVIPSSELAAFAAGPAILRLTVFGGRKLLRTPAPTIRERGVTVQR